MKSSGQLAFILLFLGLFSCSYQRSVKRIPAQDSNQNFVQSMESLYNQYKEEPVLFKEPFLSTFWGAFVDFRYILGSKKSKLSPMKLTSSDFPGTVHAYTHLQNKKSPLIVLLPGLAGEPKDAFNQRICHWFATRGYHVMVLPSPFSAEFRDWKPVFLPGDAEKEANALYRLIVKARQQIGSDNITSVDLFGSSYGAYLAPILKVIDMKQKGPIFDSAVTLLAPPVSMGSSLGLIDSWIDEVREKKECNKAVINPFFMKNVIYAEDETDLKRTAVKCSKTIMVKIGFYKTLVKMLRKHHQAHPEKFPKDLRKKKPFRKWLKEIRFTRYFNTFKKDMPGPSNEIEKTNLFYWIDQARMQGFENFKIITAKDDILNSPESWMQYDASFIERQVLMLPWGGHAGFKSTKWFQLFLDESFGPRIVEMNSDEKDTLTSETHAYEQYRSEMIDE